ncbi:unnamed protein product [Paramecium pentaurelia]|uniref:CCDC22 N-terminal domain-containing protein n=1 Tax=Paramecium pentaurelia TaxID=43138 RepID=A0A8S1S5F6_9CILI|nr:unnamed protein product [Paramecium pentaurelia]
MEDQDQMLLKSLQLQGIQIQTQSLPQLTCEDLISIFLQFFQLSGTQAFEISSIKSIKSSFRRVGKIQEMLYPIGIRIDIQSIVNPNPQESRKIIVSLLSKLSQSNKKETGAKHLTFEERLQEEKANYRTNQIQNFFQEWVNPSLCAFPEVEQRFLRLHVLNIIKKEPLIKQVANKGVRKYLYHSIVRVMDHHLQKKEVDQPLQERLQLIKKMRRSDDPEAVLGQFKGQFQAEAEKNDWEDIQKGNRQLKRAIKQLKEEDKEEEQARKQKEDENQGLFNLEIQFQEEVKEIQQEIQDTQEAKSEISALLEDIQTKLIEQQKNYDKLQKKRQKLEDINQKQQDIYSQLQSDNKDKQQELESAHSILQQIESKKGNDPEIQQLEQEIENIRIEWEKEKILQQNDADELAQQVQDRKLKLEQIQDKMRRLQEENQMIRNQGRVNLEYKEKLLVDLQNQPKEIARNQYIKKIVDLKNQLEKQKTEYLKQAKELSQLEDSLQFQDNMINRYCIEIENLINQDPKKSETVVKQIQKQYQDYKIVYKQSAELMRNIGEKRIQIYDTELKMEDILLKGYKKNVEKLRQDLTDIQAENKNLEKQKR